MTKNNWFKLIFSIAMSQTAGIVGSLFTAPAIPAWYASLNKPSFSPPNWLFGPVWVTLYALMGVALYLVWRNGLSEQKIKFAFWFFIAHLFMNAIWSIIFFGLQSPFWALVDIVVMWVMILVLIIKFWEINKTSSVLLVPYFFWVSFASVLNFAIWRLN